MIISQDKTFCFGAQFVHSFQDIARGVLFCPYTQGFGLQAKSSGIGSVIHVPNLLG